VDFGHLQPVARHDFTAQLVLCDGPRGGWGGETIDGLLGGVGPNFQAVFQVSFEPFGMNESPQRVLAMSLQPAVPSSGPEIAALPWARLLRAAEALVMAQQRNSVQEWQDAVEAAQRAAGQTDRRRKPRGRRPLGDDHYITVARRYEQLLASGDRHPVETIRKEYGVARSTAASWIRRARKRGLLGPPEHGKAKA
jgi:hypothetical protein